MRLLLDTHIALWWLTGNMRLRKAARDSIRDAVSCCVSSVSVWEVDLKFRSGKLPISATQFRDEIRSAGFLLLPLTDDHILEPISTTHADPFDRLLLSIAIHERLQLMTDDDNLLALSPTFPVIGTR